MLNHGCMWFSIPEANVRMGGRTSALDSLGDLMANMITLLIMAAF